MVRLGLDPLDALRAATRNGAELLGKLEDLGTIEPGKAADPVLCTGDVAADVSGLRNRANIRCVVQAGRIVHQ